MAWLVCYPVSQDPPGAIAPEERMLQVGYGAVQYVSFANHVPALVEPECL